MLLVIHAYRGCNHERTVFPPRDGYAACAGAGAWESELDEALDNLFESFSRWADQELSAFELGDQIHRFHDGISRTLFQRYRGLPPSTALAMDVACGALAEESLGANLIAKLTEEIQAFRARVCHETETDAT